jgi:hypothetical protein
MDIRNTASIRFDGLVAMRARKIYFYRVSLGAKRHSLCSKIFTYLNRQASSVHLYIMFKELKAFILQRA